MSFDKNLDAYIQGDFDTNAPFNQPDNEQINEVWECLDEEDYSRAYELLSEIRKEVQLLRDKAKVSNDTYCFKKLTEIYNKL